LRSDAPAELEVPANYRGNVQVPVEVEGISIPPVMNTSNVIPPALPSS
ncbi:DUF5462 family protein, partial [Salmonella enterica subsp. enterica serovar Kentucky]|nr:DUF5462 family protein [Salmonella enterica subsp. enterica serovar Kentucky]